MSHPVLLAVFALILASLAACGVDGPPTRPEPAPEPGFHVSGEARIGVTTAL